MNRNDDVLDDPSVDRDRETEPDLDFDAADDESTWDPPIDPPVVPRGRDGVEVAGAVSELVDDENLSAVDGTLGDDEITLRVRRLLRMDSSTSMLRVQVSTEDGVVTLRGLVQTYEDTDNAAEVASRVEGVVDVLDELEVED